MIFKLLTEADWTAARAAGQFDGSGVDLRDGFVHFSGADQVVETARRHFDGQTGLVLLTVDTDRLGPELRWEESRGGALFPHLYAPLPVTAVVSEDRLPDDVPAADAIAALLDDRRPAG